MIKTNLVYKITKYMDLQAEIAGYRNLDRSSWGQSVSPGIQ